MGRIAEHRHTAWLALGGESGGESTFLLSHLVHIAHQHSYLTLLLFLLENCGTSRNSVSMPVCYLLCLVLASLTSVILHSSLGSQSLSLSALKEASMASLSITTFLLCLCSRQSTLPPSSYQENLWCCPSLAATPSYLYLRRKATRHVFSTAFPGLFSRLLPGRL